MCRLCNLVNKIYNVERKFRNPDSRREEIFLAATAAMRQRSDIYFMVYDAGLVYTNIYHQRLETCGIDFDVKAAIQL